MNQLTRRGMLRGIATCGTVAAAGCMGFRLGDPLVFRLRVQNETDESHEIQVVLSADDWAVFDQTVDLGPRRGDDSARVVTESALPAGRNQFVVSVGVDGRPEVFGESFRIDCQNDGETEDSLVVQLLSEGDVFVRESQCG